MYKSDGDIALMGVGLSNDMLYKKIDELKNAISNKPETNIQLGEIVGGVMHVVESVKSGKDQVRNIRRFTR